MKIYHNINNFTGHKPVVTIGTFDGVHLGHQRVISRLKEIAHMRGGESLIFTFDPHPRIITSSNEKNLRLLTTLEEKKCLFEQSGIDHLVVFPFTKSFSQLGYSEFVKKILIDKIKIHCLVVGYDHRFGKNREGGFKYLQDCANRYNFDIEKLEPLRINEAHVSSTRIRKTLQEGQIIMANRYLGYRFTLSGKVVKGIGLGRKIGYPTANIESSDVNKLVPGYGVYAVKVIVSGKNYKGMLNIGSRPTFNNNADNRSIEVHIFNLSEDLYNKKISLVFFAKIRNEKKFSGAEALAEQLKKDKENAIAILSNC